MISSNEPVQHIAAPCPASSGSVTRALLLVDDEATLRSALRRFFVRRGWQVCEAEDGECARAILLGGDSEVRHFDAVLSDIRMPRLSGMELYTLVARADPAIARRFIFSSGDTGDEESIDFLARTGCPVISKPFDLAALLSLVERVATAPAPGVPAT